MPDSPARIDQDFGGLDQWAAQFAATGKAMGGGSGWVLLALDMYEHSYHMDFGTKASAYVDAWMNNINFAAASQKLAAITQ